MGSIKRHVHEKWFFRIDTFVDEFNGKISNRMGRVEWPAVKCFWHLIRISIETKCIIAYEEIGSTGQVTPVTVKPKVCGLLF